MNSTLTSLPPRISSRQAKQQQFGLGRHDGLQYNFFAGDKVFAVRLIESQHLLHHSAWLFDSGVQEIVNSSAPLQKSGTDSVDVAGPDFEMAADGASGSIVARSNDSDVFRIEFRSPISFEWGTPLGGGIHQPLIEADIVYRGKKYSGIGYSKRYWFEEDHHYLSWRFITGVVDDRSCYLWTADASFGGDYNKYDYFKIAYPDGTIRQASATGSFHRDNAAYATIDGAQCEVQIEPLGTWKTELRATETQLMLRQRFCRMRLIDNGKVSEGYALNETGVGPIL